MRLGPLAVDQRHRSLREAVALEERVVGLGEHVDDGVADGEDVGHGARYRAPGSVDRPCPTLDPYRLPTTVVPPGTTCELAPDLDAATFDGTVAIAVDVHEPVDEIVLNALELDIDEAWVELPDGTRLDADGRASTPSTERATLRLAPTAPAGAGHGPRPVPRRSSTTSSTASTGRPSHDDDRRPSTSSPPPRWRRPTPARRSRAGTSRRTRRPSPSSLVVPEGLTALSNGAEVGREPLGDGRVRVRFADTMKMSTYLVAFVVGPLEVTDPVDVARRARCGSPARRARST